MIKYRNYQQVAANEIDSFMLSPSRERKVIVEPVAAGKSILIAHAARSSSGGVLVLQPSVELLRQNYNKYIGYGLEASIYSSSANEKKLSKVIFATLGSIKSLAYKLKVWGITTLVVDEVHLGYPADKFVTKKHMVDGVLVSERIRKKSMFSKFIDELSPNKILGFTATPFVLKNRGKDGGSELRVITEINPKIFDDILLVEQVSTMTSGKYWADLSYKCYDFQEGLLRYNTSGTEFTEESIAEANQKLNVNQNAYLEAKSLIKNPDNQILIFAESVKTSLQLQKYIPFSRVVCGETPKKEREKIIKDFSTGTVRVVITVQALLTGFDAPNITHVIWARPTGSFMWYYQGNGRAVRLHPKQLPAQIIDLCGNVKRFGRIEDLQIFKHPSLGWMATVGEYMLSNIKIGAKIKYDAYTGFKLGKNKFKTDVYLPKGQYMATMVNKVPVWYLQKQLEIRYFADTPEVEQEIERYLEYAKMK